MATPQQLANGLCLRFPGDIENQPGLSIEAAVNLLIRGTQASLQLPFTWGYIDRPAGTWVSLFPLSWLTSVLDADGAIYLIFLTSQMTFPNDGMRFQENEQRFPIPAGNGRVRHPSVKKFAFSLDSFHAHIGGGSDGSQVWIHCRLWRKHSKSRPTEIPDD